jgi:predicted AAA+ superfamily ATPase
MIQRALLSVLEKRLFKGKAIVLLGPRQVGKTTLIQTLLNEKEHLFLNGDDPDVRELLSHSGMSRLKAIIGKHTLVFVDEAQRINQVGVLAKMITDQMKHVQLILSGSSALDLNNVTQEPLTGRKFEYQLFPISWQEFEDHVGYVEASAQLEERLIFGMYPDVMNNRDNAREVLQQLTTSYLYRDLLTLSGIKKPELLGKLLRALALQLGSEVSYNELANLLEVDKATISKYIDLLEKSFIVFRLNSYSSNQRNELKNSRKIYFYDNGIRNMVINNLNALELRNDKGALWENFLISERIKLHTYHQVFANYYFWRTVQKQEVDYIEEMNGHLEAYEFKWSSKGRVKLPSTFTNRYGVEGRVIDHDHFRDFLRIDE